MDTTKVNDKLQLLASIGVLVGLFVVAYELRQNKAFAEAEHNRGTYGMWMQATSLEMESDIGELVIKSIEDPNNLSKPEKFRVNAWLTHIVSIYDHGDRALELGVATPSTHISEAEALYYFSSDYSRQWFKANRYWMRPYVAETISRAIESTPVSTNWNPVEIYTESSKFE